VVSVPILPNQAPRGIPPSITPCWNQAQQWIPSNATQDLRVDEGRGKGGYARLAGAFMIGAAVLLYAETKLLLLVQLCMKDLDASLDGMKRISPASRDSARSGNLSCPSAGRPGGLPRVLSSSA